MRFWRRNIAREYIPGIIKIGQKVPSKEELDRKQYLLQQQIHPTSNSVLQPQNPAMNYHQLYSSSYTNTSSGDGSESTTNSRRDHNHPSSAELLHTGVATDKPSTQRHYSQYCSTHTTLQAADPSFAAGRRDVLEPTQHSGSDSECYESYRAGTTDLGAAATRIHGNSFDMSGQSRASESSGDQTTSDDEYFTHISKRSCSPSHTYSRNYQSYVKRKRCF
uniref:Uncharacterized protein n=1 Tax=Lygus hesperus TaxID=30085 RepID=A0A0A9WD22_LYGHE